ncbi:hypothetical protein, conserved [Leishmania tarentolae]|uniref:Uncharacterized protein n=1 Tax=Leishmania tarentolae TaxID=5689 RepID=A0A640KMC0_LEITA|nr:hypothetical protein, conserved [Leishmania tarentolae]
MGGALCTVKPHVGSHRDQPVAPQYVTHESDGISWDVPRPSSDAPPDTSSAPGPRVLKHVGTTALAHNVESNSNIKACKNSASSYPHSLPRSLVRPLPPSSSSSILNLQSTQTPSHALSIGMAEATATDVPHSASSMPEMEMSANSSCSAFSLYSADSSTTELPLPPPRVLESLTSLRAVKPTKEPPARHMDRSKGSTLQHSSAISGASLMTTCLSPKAAASTPAPPVTSPLAKNFFVPQNFREYSGSAASKCIDKTSGNDPPQAAAGSFATSSSITTAAAAAQIVSSALLDVSFDSRAFAVNDAATSTEIQRLGIRLWELQRGHQELGVGREVSALLSSRNSGGNSASCTQNLFLDASKGISEAPPGASTASLESAPKSVESSLSEQVLARRQVHDETMKFVNLIQEIHDSRAAGQAGYTWFRWKDVPPKTNSSEVGAATGDTTGASPSSASENAPLSGHRCDVPVGSAANYLQHRSLLRRRDPTSSHVHWVPFEMRESDFRTGNSITPVCFCGYQSTAVLPYGTGLTHNRDHYPAVNMEVFTANSQRFLEVGVSCAVTPSFADTPPLPSITPSAYRASTLGADADKDSTHCFIDSKGPLSSSAGTITSTSLNSFSSDSISFCPIHVAHRPVSILVRGKGKGSEGTIFSPPRRALPEPMQVDVPATATTGSASAKLSSAQLPLLDTPHPTGDGSSCESGRQLIINSKVPHRRQLAKRALEDNKLFFEMFSKRRSLT